MLVLPVEFVHLEKCSLHLLGTHLSEALWSFIFLALSLGMALREHAVIWLPPKILLVLVHPHDELVELRCGWKRILLLFAAHEFLEPFFVFELLKSLVVGLVVRSLQKVVWARNFRLVVWIIHTDIYLAQLKLVRGVNDKVVLFVI